MFKLLDERSTLTRRQKLIAIVAAWAVCLEFLDYFLIGFILTFVSGPWHLTFLQSSWILLSSGAGAIVGALFFGWLADKIGRRKVFLTTVTVFTLATLALVFTPDHPTVGWAWLVTFRVIIGFGAGGLYVVDLPLVQEYMPQRKRGMVSGLVTATIPVGFLLGSLMVWLLSDVIGWRGILVVAAALGFTVLLMRVGIPESPRYLASRGEVARARASIAWVLDMDVAEVPDEIDVPAGKTEAKVSIKELIKYPRSFWTSVLTNLGMQTGYYGLALWAPTLLVLIAGVSPAQTGFYMVFITLGALGGRFAFSYMSEWIGRRWAGGIGAMGAVITLIIAAATADLTIGALSAFFLMMIVVYFFGEGGFAIVGPYSAEVWPSHLRTTGMGFAYGIGGFGKVIGPLGLALILGSDNLLKPEATETGIMPAFLYFAGWYALTAVMFLFVGFETRNKTIQQLDIEIEQQRRDASTASSADAALVRSSSNSSR